MTRTTLTRVLRPVVDTSLVPTWDGAVWIGELDRAELHGAGHRDAIGLAGADGYSRARLLVRDRGEPVGFVEAEVTDRRRIGPSIELRTLERAVRHMPTPERRPAADQALPSVTVVLCTDGDAGETMRSVLAQRGVALDVVVVSAGADGDGRTEIAGRTVTTVPAPTGGLAAARNAGLLAATGDVVAFLGSGAVVDPDWAAAIAAPFVLDDDVACVTGLVPTAEIRTPAQRWHDEHTPAARTIRRRVFRLGDEPGDTPLHPFAAAAYGTGANLAVRRRAALSIGGFDTAFGPGTRVGGGDDLDLFTRLLFAGSAIAVEPAAIAWVRPADDTSSLRRTAAAHGHGLGAWMTKNALDRDTVAATVDSVPEAIAAFARLGLEQGDAVTELGGGSGRRAAGRPAVASAASGAVPVPVLVLVLVLVVLVVLVVLMLARWPEPPVAPTALRPRLRARRSPGSRRPGTTRPAACAASSAARSSWRRSSRSPSVSAEPARSTARDTAGTSSPPSRPRPCCPVRWDLRHA